MRMLLEAVRSLLSWLIHLPGRLVHWLRTAPGRFVRYVVETRDGSSHAFRLTEDRRPGPSAMVTHF